jgi:hypothetical protein
VKNILPAYLLFQILLFTGAACSVTRYGIPSLVRPDPSVDPMASTVRREDISDRISVQIASNASTYKEVDPQARDAILKTLRKTFATFNVVDSDPGVGTFIDIRTSRDKDVGHAAAFDFLIFVFSFGLVPAEFYEPNHVVFRVSRGGRTIGAFHYIVPRTKTYCLLFTLISWADFIVEQAYTNPASYVAITRQFLVDAGYDARVE